MKIKRGKFMMMVIIIFLFFVIAIVSNYHSLENAKSACVENYKTSNVEQGFLAMNWNVTCE
ncbi:hypothetical protein DS031_22190 [Bacillus taeanensis]|uniref:Uncharacterized protein n=1 Tax=Bacillus taeanensis TaxID=273032 RepID=A0A366XNF9_9BACI|nr:hypothetical protein DS031_22190 [Bacillus taeanensis]